MRQGGVPDAMWFCFFSSSVSRGLSSAAPAAPFSRDDVDALFGDDMVRVSRGRYGKLVVAWRTFVRWKMASWPKAFKVAVVRFM